MENGCGFERGDGGRKRRKLLFSPSIVGTPFLELLIQPTLLLMLGTEINLFSSLLEVAM